MTTRRHARAIAVLTVAALLGGGTAAASGPRPGPSAASATPGLQRLVDRIVERGSPGATLLVRDDAAGRAFTSGVADVESERPLRPDDRYRIGSVTKTVVATLTLQLVEQGALDLDAPVADYLAQLLPGGEDITIRHLLGHTSGLFNYSEDADFLDRLVAGESFRPRELLGYSTRHEVLFPPGTDFSYSNTNYVVIGLLLRKVGHAKIKSQLTDRILDPLHLTDTSFPIRDKTLPGRFSRGYLGLGGDELLDVTSEFSPTWAWAAGAMIGDTSDLLTFYRALLAGDLIGPAMLEEMKELGPSRDYGLGLIVLDLPCGTAYGHDGLFVGYYTFALSTEDGAHQAVIMINVDPLNGVPPPDVIAALVDALLAGFCGDAGLDPSALLRTPELARHPLGLPASAGEG